MYNSCDFGRKCQISKILSRAEKKFCITICITVVLEIGSGAINANPALSCSIALALKASKSNVLLISKVCL